MFNSDTVHSMYEAIAQELFSQNYDMNATNPELNSVTMIRRPNGEIQVRCKASFNVWIPKPERKR